MTRTTTFFLLVLASLPHCARNAQLEPVYRYINVRGGQILLGEPFGRRDIAEQSDDTTFRLRPGTFGGGGTTQIVAHTDPAGILRSLIFVYDGSEPLSAKVRQYTASLGKPLHRHDSKEGTEFYVWEDRTTRFELHYDPKHDPPFWSQLTDRTRS